MIMKVLTRIFECLVLLAVMVFIAGMDIWFGM